MIVLMRKQISAVLLLVGALAFAEPGDELVVSVETVPLRSSASFLGQASTTLIYEDVVIEVSRQPSWIQVELSDGTRGWIPETAVIAPRSGGLFGGAVAGGAARDVEADEVALAGRGFSAGVEAEYAEQNPDISRALDLVDQIEANEVSIEKLQAFLEAGGGGSL